MHYYENLDIGKVYAPGTPSKLGVILQRITNLTEVRMLSKLDVRLI
jgi:hypothetical protein